MLLRIIFCVMRGLIGWMNENKLELIKGYERESLNNIGWRDGGNSSWVKICKNIRGMKIVLY